MSISLSKLLMGRSLANSEADEQKIGVLAGVPAMGLDGLGSAAYGPEAALSILVVAGPAGLSAMEPVTWVILAVLGALYLSYRQTIAAYPSNGGSYVVAKENLGANAGLLAAAALMIDYTLNVAVGISAGVAALTSALPVLQPQTLPLCLVILAALTLVNLRGTKEAGLMLAVPTYLFIASLGGILLWGVVRLHLAGGHPHPVVAPPAVPHAREAVGLWLLLRCFASGCTAMTGVESVSNGVGAFRDPTVRTAHGTLTVIVAVLAVLLLGIGHLAHAYGIMAMDQTQPGYQSVLSQLVGAVYGRGWLYDVTIGSVLAVLCLSANTSFVGFPRLCRLVAVDGFLPRPFAVAGRRLVYSAGILFLAGGAACLLVAFGGITDRLIPLFAVGAFLSFTLSQAGMAMHWRREPGHRTQLLVNGFGACVTAAALAIILLAKFAEGAWLTVLVIPTTLFALRAVHRYYEGIDRQVLLGSHRRIDLHDHTPPIVLVPVARWDRVTRKAVEYGLRLSRDVTALHVMRLDGPDADSQQQKLRQEWHDWVEQPAQDAGLPPPRLLMVPSQYRSVVAPLLRAIEDADHRFPGRPVMIVLPELIEARWWSWVMHTHRERKLRARLLRYGGPDVTVVSVPWQLQAAKPRQGVAEEER
jgi:amino acid transporter